MSAPVRLRCEALHEPLGIGVVEPRLSWVPQSLRRAATQVAYEILVASSSGVLGRGDGDLWASGRVESKESVHVAYGGTALTSRQRCWWKVRTWGDDGDPSPWSEPTFFEMGLLARSDWSAAWISFPNEGDREGHRPSAHLRTSFVIEAPVTRARLYVTALGLYRAEANGERVGHDHMTPGWTDYHQRLQYQTYDLTSQLIQGENVLGIVLGDGWYRGHVGHEGQVNSYGDRTEAFAQLEVEFADGSRQVVVTDDSWRGAFGPILWSDLLMGETYDARREMPGWSAPGFDDAAWEPVTMGSGTGGELVAQRSPTVQVMRELHPVALSQPSPGTWLFDLGQNMVGWARLRVRGEAGDVVTLRFAEEVHPDGSAYTENTGSARCTDEYTLHGGGEEVFEPSFTYRGFRYVQVSGYPGTPSPDAITGLVAHSNTPSTGTFSCSNAMVNRLQQNIVWSQRGNFFDVPTDCPQRDERLGWMGDAQMFAPTAALNMDVEAFYAKWMDDVLDAQTPDGAFPDVAPRQVQLHTGAPAWGDAGVIVPWTMFRRYGDRRTLERSFDAMVAWVDWIHRNNPDLIWLEGVGQNFGDWDCHGEETPKEVVSTAYFARSAQLTARSAEVLGRQEEAARFAELADRIKHEFATRLIDSDGGVLGDTQTGYALAIVFDLVPANLQGAVASRFRSTIERTDAHVTTGFVGLPLLFPALTAAGHLDLAYRLLLQDTFPSWGYEIGLGATTIWERWDGWTAEAGFVDPEIGGSFNHFAFGSVGEWLFERVAGITGGASPAYGDIVIHPMPGGDLKWAAATLDSPRGMIASAWSRDGVELRLTVTIPANTQAEVRIPASVQAVITEGGHDVADAEGVESVTRGAELAAVRLGSGTYSFAVVNS